MLAALLAGALIFSAQTPPSEVDTDGDSRTAALRSAIACLNRFFSTAEAEIAARQIARLRVEHFQEGGSFDPALPEGAANCLRMVPADTQEHRMVSDYARAPLLLRGLRELLGSASVDVAALDRLAPTPEIKRAVAMPGAAGTAALGSILAAAGVPEAQRELAAAYVVLKRYEPVRDAIVRLPARLARHVDGSIYPHDYSALARRQRLQGVVVVTYLIERDGRLSTCEVILSSGHSLLDDLTCALLTTRFRYLPARDENGQPVTEFGLRRIYWRMP